MSKFLAALACVTCFLAACGGDSGGDAGSVTLVHSYGGTASDSVPTSIILGSDSNFYAVTYSGGANGEYQERYLSGRPYPVFVPNTAGAFVRINPAGDSAVLWDFGNDAADGLNPSSLIEGMDGTFYGTTTYGGLNNSLFSTRVGTVFKFSRGGVEKILWSFSSATPFLPSFPSSLIQATDGNFYGVTSGGGVIRYVNEIINGQPTVFAVASGTVFRLTPDGVMTELWNFGEDGDGAGPSKLIQGADGNLYGITVIGGAYGRGTVFKITLDGAETVLWSFCGLGDGCTPNSLIQGTDGNLYGTTSPDVNDPSSNGGTVFQLSTTGDLTVLWNFNPSQDKYVGYYPIDLIEGTDRNFYGTTAGGGMHCSASANCKFRGGTLFQLTPRGTFTVLWSFGTGTDGDSPNRLVWGADGHLYGVTGDGGKFGKGSLFRY